MRHELVAKTAGLADCIRAARSNSRPPGHSTKDGLRVLSVDYKARESRDRSDSAGLSVEWVFRRNVSANVLVLRTRIDNPISPLSAESDAVSVRVRIRL